MKQKGKGGREAICAIIADALSWPSPGATGLGGLGNRGGKFGKSDFAGRTPGSSDLQGKAIAKSWRAFTRSCMFFHGKGLLNKKKMGGLGGMKGKRWARHVSHASALLRLLEVNSQRLLVASSVRRPGVCETWQKFLPCTALPPCAWLPSENAKEHSPILRCANHRQSAHHFNRPLCMHATVSLPLLCFAQAGSKLETLTCLWQAGLTSGAKTAVHK